MCKSQSYDTLQAVLSNICSLLCIQQQENKEIHTFLSVCADSVDMLLVEAKLSQDIWLPPPVHFVPIC